MSIGLSIIAGLGVALFGFVLQTSVAGLNRKVVARLQKRYGPKWYQEFIDIFKLLSKRATSHGWIFDFGVIMALGGIIATAMFMPITNNLLAFEGFDNFFIFVYLIAVGMLGMAMSASGSGNPLASIGVMRALTTMLAYEVPFMVIVLTIINLTGESSVSAIAQAQQLGGDFNWFIIALPIGGVVAVLSLMGMLGKKPFETYIAPAEIASGPMVEYGGKQLGMLFIMHEITVFIEVSLFVHLFLGGAENIIIFLVKYVAVYTFVNLISYVNGRFKIDQVVVFFYKWPLLLAVIQAVMAIYLGLVI
ncbi:respiratory chain complex I subunit 1 family protein [Candidatus Xianfuyuplasma coldseepsis]|uniref:Proton-conducting membrane transporter n=1 Tax=Candidatus Xianfuyuplasma coldseepsis TaxID=2782163 RepID=A0A7L7KT08_9MOLU|nr:NADH-quinone oxidoreductase subunit H [Xianfuyuplasma coldseepsis]QMS85950.1 proton-conducting membrane transporter [Xianfuyuplasma coldseepsis]